MPHLHQMFMADDFIDVTTDSEFFGLTTFANLPYVNCFKPDENEASRYDIAILGAPFDTVSRISIPTSWNKLTIFKRV
jgi:agmatinase